MTAGTASELIAEANVMHTRLDGATNVCAIDDNDWPCVTKQLADALESATTLQVVTTVAELDALPRDTLIQEYDGFRRLKMHDGRWLLGVINAGIGPSSEIVMPTVVLSLPRPQ